MSPQRAAAPLLAIKRVIPPVRGSVLVRHRLEKRLAEGTRLTIVSAPAGWGKTSLVSRWATAHAAEQPVAWVSLDAGDDEPIRFWSYALAAMRDVSGAISAEPSEALIAGGDGPTALALPLLLNELIAATTSLTLVFDDYHVITHPEIHEGLEFLITHLPSHVRIVLATRIDPPLPLARMRVRGELTEVRAVDLQFSEQESVTLLENVVGSDIDSGAAARILDRTEGWAAGLQLAGLAVADSMARGRDAGDFGADQRHLFDYFASEVLPSFAPQHRDLLIRAAPLELLCGSLCDAALDVSGSGGVLAELERAGMFVVALDDAGEWYRCHSLLRSALGWSPHAAPDAGTRDVLRRAAAWYVEHDRLDDAVRTLQDARDFTTAVEVLQEHRRWFVERGWAANLLELAARLPEDVVTPGAALGLAYVATTCGREDRIGYWLDIAARNTRPDSVVPGWRSLRAAELSMRGLFTTDFGTPDVAVALLEESVALETAAGTADPAIAMIGLADAYGFAGRFTDAAEILTRYWNARESLGLSTTVGLQAVGQLLLFLQMSGASHELDEILPQAAAAADALEQSWGSGIAGPVIVMTRLIQGRRSYERGDLRAADEFLARGLWFAELSAHPLWRVIGLVFTADLRLGEGDRRQGREALVRAREAVDAHAVPPFIRALLEASENRIGHAAARTAARAGHLFEELTDRELSVLRMLPGTATQREIGAALFLSINTVKGYTKSVYRKLDVGGRQEAVQVARRIGLI